ncbi:MAG: DUF1203 domain-containing protein [Alphaproteobacteria bacterium]|nr:DUF1203 domain-containing protein [Alphaproteobacteria bacterium]MBV9694563.1 DUF1203 domain-containing protein [Alphaproteobacteria bacterium]
MPFRAVGLPLAEFASLFALGDHALAAQGMRRMTADSKPGFPCRVTLEDAEPGESLILLTYRHQRADTPYRASGPIFVREKAQAPFDAVDTVPVVLRGRSLSLRAYDAAGFMRDADVVEGAAVEDAIARLFADAAISYLHIHNAKRGCFACRVERA